MFGSIGFWELVMIFMVVMFLFGPDKLPEIAQLIGKTLREFRRQINAAKSTLEDEFEKAGIPKNLEDTGIGRDVKQIGEDLKGIDAGMKEKLSIYDSLPDSNIKEIEQEIKEELKKQDDPQNK